MYRSICLLIILMFHVNITLAQKSASLDNQKALKTQIGCQRIADLKLIHTTVPIQINCQIDNMTFKSEVLIKGNQTPVRIGNFNLLHPGTDKTLFKDFGLVAELINKEFDVMAAVELVDVLATPKANNLLLLPLIEENVKELRPLNDKIHDLKEQIIELSRPTESSGPSDQEVKLQKLLEQREIQIAQILKSTSDSESELKIASNEVALNSVPGRSLLGYEFGKKKRLQRLERAIQEETILKDKLVSLEEQKILVNNQIADIQNQIRKLPNVGSISAINLQLIEKLDLNLKSLELKAKKLEQALAKITRYYRIPGYLKILEELRKIDSSWSLIMSPHGDAAVETNTQEHTGFYYRASRISLSRNMHCSNQYNKFSAGCYPNFYADYMNENKATIFSRRPFMATFTEGSSSFTIIAAHVVFESETDPEKQKVILEKAFDVEALGQLPTGINKQNYARFAETLVTLQLIEKLRAEGLEHIIYTGDFNLEIQNPFWSHIFSKVPGSVVLIEEKTSLSESRFVKGQESGGVSSNYDHFILSKDDASSCSKASVLNFMKNDFAQRINDKYLVRVNADKGPYEQSERAVELIANRSLSMQAILESYNFFVNKNNEIVNDPKATAEDMHNFQTRVFDSQLKDETYYKFFAQIISDHLPIKIECQF